MPTPDVAATIAARARALDSSLRPAIHETPVVRWEEAGAADVWLKLENRQVTGSFKARGAYARLGAAKAAGAHEVVASSTGNHGTAVAHAAAALEMGALVYVPRSAQPAKVAAITALGAELVLVDGDPVRAETAARAHAARGGIPYVSPYNDPEVVAGQATVGLELARQLAPVDEVYVAVGGGGLISGLGIVLREAWPDCTIVGAYPQNSPSMARSVAAGRIVEVPALPTLSDGTAGGVEPGSITLDLCARFVDRWVEVPERDIAPTIRRLHGDRSLLVEGAAAVAAFAALGRARTSALVIVCGGNLDPDVAAGILG